MLLRARQFIRTTCKEQGRATCIDRRHPSRDFDRRPLWRCSGDTDQINHRSLSWESRYGLAISLCKSGRKKKLTEDHCLARHSQVQRATTPAYGQGANEGIAG